MKVKAKHLKFKVKRKVVGHEILPGSFFRLCSRTVAAFIINSATFSYQMWDEREDRLFQGSKYDLAHWILYNAGYECCIHDLQQLTGRELKLKDKSGVLTHILKRQ
jgi:hypothetical protein